MQLKMVYNILPEYQKLAKKNSKIAALILACTTVFILIISLFVHEVMIFVVIWIYFIFLMTVIGIVGSIGTRYKAHIFDDHFEIVNWCNKAVHYIYFDEITALKIKLVKDVTKGPNAFGNLHLVNTLCIGINITEDELEGLTERNTFMDLLRYSKICVPMAYNEEVYQFIKSKINPSGDCI